MLRFIYDDGGRTMYFKAANVNDCVVRSIAIATGNDYKSVYNETKRLLGYSPRNGVYHHDVKKVMKHFGGEWVACMKVGKGCTAHLVENEIPMRSRIVCNLSKHVVAVINGVMHDTYDSSRNGTRCVYGYWKFKKK